jgi:hypothetical protein
MIANSRGQAFSIALFVISLFSHNVLSSRPVFVTLGLLSAMAVLQGRPRSEPAQLAAAPRLARSSRLVIHRPRLMITPDWLVLPPYQRD